MYKKLLTIAFSSFLITACGGGGGSSSSSGGTTGGGTTGGTDGGTDGGTVVGGQSGSFGDSAAAANGIDGTFTICPDSAPGSFSSFTQDGANWCVKRCPAGVAIENDDGDPWGRYNDDGDLLVCRDENVAPGSQITIEIFAPIAGCPDGGCPTNSFPKVFISAAAGAEVAGSYTCAPWLFDQVTQVWNEQSSPASFSLSLNADNSATIAGTSTTWSFSNGTLFLEGNRTFNNVAFGSGSFSSYDSNTALTRCTS